MCAVICVREMDDLTNRYERLTLTEEEEEVITVPSRGGELDATIADLALIGRQHTDKMVNVEAMRKTLASIRRMNRGLLI